MHRVPTDQAEASSASERANRVHVLTLKIDGEPVLMCGLIGARISDGSITSLLSDTAPDFLRGAADAIEARLLAGGTETLCQLEIVTVGAADALELLDGFRKWGPERPQH